MNKTQMWTPADIFYGLTNNKGDLSRFWIFCLGTLVFLARTDFKLIVFQTFWLWAYLMKVIPKMRRVH